MENKRNIVLLVVVGIVLLSMLMWVLYGLSDNGRFIRDYGIVSSGISDDEVKSIWCNNLGYNGSYDKIEGEEYCGENKVILDCRFTNRGDFCSIEKVTRGSQ